MTGAAKTPSIPRLPARLAVMLSGTGRTLLNLLGAVRSGSVSAEIPLVIASRECPGARHAREAGIETVVVPGEIPADRLEKMLAERSIDLIACAGYLKRLRIPVGFEGRILNIHPALLPAFGGVGMYGGRVHAAVLGSGAAESGCTVHVVDDEYDRGPIVAQARCPVLPTDDAATLAARVFELECRLYPKSLQQIILCGVVT